MLFFDLGRALAVRPLGAQSRPDVGNDSVHHTDSDEEDNPTDVLDAGPRQETRAFAAQTAVGRVTSDSA